MAIPQLVKNSPAFYKKTKDSLPLFTETGHLVPVMSQLIPVHTLPSCMSKMHFTSIPRSTMEPSKCPPPFGFSHKNPVSIFLLSHSATCHVTSYNLTIIYDPKKYTQLHRLQGEKLRPTVLTVYVRFRQLTEA